jgi:hypothetical protein
MPQPALTTVNVAEPAFIWNDIVSGVESVPVLEAAVAAEIVNVLPVGVVTISYVPEIVTPLNVKLPVNVIHVPGEAPWPPTVTVTSLLPLVVSNCVALVGAVVRTGVISRYCPLYST